MIKHRAGSTLRLISHEGFQAVEPTEVRLTWSQRFRVLCTGRVISVIAKPHPEVVDVGLGTYFGHPETIKTFAEEVKAGQRSQQQPRPQLHTVHHKAGNA